MTQLDLAWIRAQFPSLAQTHTHALGDRPLVFFDGPGGTQIPQAAIDAVSRYFLTSNANLHGAYVTSARTDALVTTARSAVADLLNCDADEIVFGANMTTLTFAISRSIARTLQPGDEIIVTTLDHDANVAPWLALTERGVIVRTVDIHPEDCTLDWADFERQLSDRTKLVAVCYASNAVGTINDLEKIVQLAHTVGAWVFVDAVHYAPHGVIDVRSLDCDFLVCSAYKFFAPHIGILYAKRQHLQQLQPYKARPAPEEIPWRWETGTQSFEGMAGLVATIDYLAELGRHVTPKVSNRRDAIVAAMTAIQTEERSLSQTLISGLQQIRGVTLYGITDPDRFAWRTPTVGIRVEGFTPRELAKALGDRGICTWNGNFYALNLTQRLGIEASGGLLRIGLVHYNTLEEIQYLLDTLHELVAVPAMSVS